MIRRNVLSNHLLTATARTHHFGRGWNGIENIIAILLLHAHLCWTHFKFLRDLARLIPHQRVLHRLVLVLKTHVLVNVFRRLRRVHAYAYAYNTRDLTNQESSAYCWLSVGHSDTHVTFAEPQKNRLGSLSSHRN